MMHLITNRWANPTETNEVIPLDSTQRVSFSATMDEHIIFLFAQIKQNNFYLGNCPTLGFWESWVTKFRNVQIVNKSVKIAETHLTKTSVFYKYLVDRENLELELLSKVDHLPATQAPYSQMKKESLVSRLVSNINSIEAINFFIVVGVPLNQTFFICSEGEMFGNVDAIRKHHCKVTTDYLDYPYMKHTYTSLSTEYTIRSFVESKFPQETEILKLLIKKGATEQRNEKHSYISSVIFREKVLKN